MVRELYDLDMASDVHSNTLFVEVVGDKRAHALPYLVDALLGDALADGGDLGNDGLAQVAGGGLLVLE